MKKLKVILTQVLLVTSLMLPWATTEALETFEQAGHITKVGVEQFTVRGKKYRLAPGARLQSNDPARLKIKHLKKGDEVYMKGQILNGVRYVDIIVYVKPDAS